MFNPSEHFVNLQGGKKYLQVMWRLVWFREDHPDWSVDTTMIHYDAEKKHAIFKAVVSDANGVQKSTGTGSESASDFKDFIEKAETKAIGRALAILGYGTQFAPELDEEERIVDSPVRIKIGEKQTCQWCSKDIVDYKGKTAEQWAIWSVTQYGIKMCGVCAMNRYKEEKVNKNE